MRKQTCLGGVSTPALAFVGQGLLPVTSRWLLGLRRPSLRSGSTAGSRHQEYGWIFVFYLLDLMSLSMVSANNELIAKRIIKEIETFKAERDDSETEAMRGLLNPFNTECLSAK